MILMIWEVTIFQGFAMIFRLYEDNVFEYLGRNYKVHAQFEVCVQLKIYVRYMYILDND